MKRLLSLIFLLATMPALFSCGTKPKTTEKTETETTPGSHALQTKTEEPGLSSVVPQPLLGVSVKEKNYTQLKNALSWENICAFSIKRSDMTVQEMREACVNFFRYCKTAVWIPDDSVTFRHVSSPGKTDQLVEGTVYGGLPYVAMGNGNIYRLLDYMDPKTGVVDLSFAVDIEGAGKLTGVNKTMRLFGNQCSFGAYWGWGRVINSANYGGTNEMVLKNGFLRVGDYSYAPYGDSLEKFDKTNTTTRVLQENGEQVMYESYARLHPADGLVYYTTAGHVIMASSEPVVVRRADGTVDGEKSYLTVIEQATGWQSATSAAGDNYKYKKGVDVKMTFRQLFQGSYLPFTFAEFLGKDPVEETRCEFSLTKEALTCEELAKGSVNCNYGISDVYVTLKDERGEIAFQRVIRTIQADVRSVQWSGEIPVTELAPLTGKRLSVEIVCQLSTGERPLIYRGTLS